MTKVNIRLSSLADVSRESLLEAGEILEDFEDLKKAKSNESAGSAKSIKSDESLFFTPEKGNASNELSEFAKSAVDAATIPGENDTDGWTYPKKTGRQSSTPVAHACNQVSNVTAAIFNMVGLKSPVPVQENSSEDASENSNRFAALADHDEEDIPDPGTSSHGQDIVEEVQQDATLDPVNPEPGTTDDLVQEQVTTSEGANISSNTSQEVSHDPQQDDKEDFQKAGSE